MKIQQSSNISAFGGINFVFEFLDQNKIGDLFIKQLPLLKPQSKYTWKDIYYSILSIYLCGGDCIEDLQFHLKGHFKMNPFINMPSPDTVLTRLKQISQESKECMTKRGSVTHLYNTNTTLEQLNLLLLKKLGAFKSEQLTVDYDNTIIFNEKSDSKMTYKKGFGYQPGVCTINEDKVLYIENRNGNSDAKSFQDQTIARIFNLLKSSNIKKVDHFRADAASYQYDVIKLLNNEVKNFYIGCRNSYVEKYFSQINEWEPMKDSTGDTMEVGQIQITPFVNQAKKDNQQPKEYRLVVKIKLNPKMQINAFTQDAYDYRVILTNNTHYSTKKIAIFYNHRGNMEKQFDILKNEFGWNNMPFSTLENNTVFFYLLAMCRNLYTLIISHFSKLSKNIKSSYRVKKFLFRFIILPAKWVKRSRQYQLRIFGKINFVT